MSNTSDRRARGPQWGEKDLLPNRFGQCDHGHAGKNFTVARFEAEDPIPCMLGGGAAVVEVEFGFSYETVALT